MIHDAKILVSMIWSRLYELYYRAAASRRVKPDQLKRFLGLMKAGGGEAEVIHSQERYIKFHDTSEIFILN